ncbi:MAG: hypothetical protein EKK42_32790 [Pseudonocardiaceae bacterium]|nr:MAG: hypothetical protein EKK42_32790 [Pseudonocardiaceae bacterium]
MTAVGVVATGTLAALGLRSFSKFKQEKIEERRIEVSLDALTIAYESKFVFQAIRARASSSHEWEGATDESYSVPGGISVLLREAQRAPYAVIKRIENHKEFFDRITKIEPRFMAVFGSETEQIFSRIHNARIQLESAAGQLFDMGRIEYDTADAISRDQLRELRALIFRGPTESKDQDKIGDLVDGFRVEIEAICRPIVDQQYGKRKRTPR